MNKPVFVLHTNAFGDEPIIAGVYQDWADAAQSFEGAAVTDWLELNAEERGGMRVWAHTGNFGDRGYFITEATIQDRLPF